MGLSVVIPSGLFLVMAASPSDSPGHDDLGHDDLGQPVDDLDLAVRHGTTAAIAAQLVSQLLSLVVLGVLFRLVAPRDFGLLGMVLPLVLWLRSIAGLGLHVASVSQRELSAGQCSRLFWCQLAFGAATTCGIAACGPLLALIYSTPEVTQVAWAVAGLSLVVAAGIQHQALLERKLRLRQLVTLRLIGQLAGGLVGVAAAWRGYGVWALVAQQYAEVTVITAGAWWLEAWRPGYPWSREPIRALVVFGGYWTFSTLIFSAAQNLDKILLAAWVGGSETGLAALGMYTQAFQLAIRPVYLVTTPATAIMLPALARATHRPELFAGLIVRFFRMVAIVLFPCALGLIMVSSEVAQVLGGARWLEMGGLLAVLAVSIIGQGLVIIAGSVFSAAGRPRQLFAGALVVGLLVLQACLAGLAIGGRWAASPSGAALGLAWGFSLASTVIVCLPYLHFCLRTVGVATREVLAALAGPFRSALLMGALVWALSLLLPELAASTAAVRLALLVPAGAATYALLARHELTWFLEELRTDSD